QPTRVDMNFKSRAKDVPTYSRLLFTFTRPVALSALETALSIAPETDGTVGSLSGQTQFAWSPSKPLADLTVYTVTLSPLDDLSPHHIACARWLCTTNTDPRTNADARACDTS